VAPQSPTGARHIVKIIAGFLRSPEGRAALDRAIEEAQLRDAELVVVHSLKDEVAEVQAYREEFAAVGERLEELGLQHTLKEYVRGNTPAEDLLQAAKDLGADLIVIGIRRRSPVGKLLLGSNAQEILLHAEAPVLCVKAAAE
jgi:nucleotide-binding universal stress UspA family protein